VISCFVPTIDVIHIKYYNPVIMGIESGPSGYEEPVDRIELPYSDESLQAAVLDTEMSRILYDREPVLWLRSTIGVDTERGASLITDRELAERHSEGGFAEWDPKVAQSVRDYLTSRGFLGLRGSALSE
jgi:hypothetical protein